MLEGVEGATFSYNFKTKVVSFEIANFQFDDTKVEEGDEIITTTEVNIRQLEKFVRAAILYEESKGEEALDHIYSELMNVREHQEIKATDVGDLTEILGKSRG